MALFRYLIIYISLMDLDLEIEKTLRDMSHYLRYEIERELRKGFHSEIYLVVHLSSTNKKKGFLEENRTTIKEIKQLIFMGKETRALSSYHNFKKIAKKTELFSKQNEGWLITQKPSCRMQTKRVQSSSKSEIIIHSNNESVNINNIPNYIIGFLHFTYNIRRSYNYDIILRYTEDLGRFKRLTSYFEKGERIYGFIKNLIRKILFSIRVLFMSRLLIRKTSEITNKIKARIPYFLGYFKSL